MSRSLPLLGIMLCAAGAAAQEASGPPPVITISREEVKAGRMAANEKVAAGFAALANRTSAPSRWIGLVPLTGDENVSLFLSPYGSFAAFEATNNAWEQAMGTASAKAEMEQLERQNAEVQNSWRTMLARHRADLSYRPRSAKEAAQSRYFSINSVRLKPGRAPDYSDYIKALNIAREKANVDVHTAVYQVVGGAPTGTFLTFTTYRSLKEVDDGFARADADQKAIEAALGGPTVVERRRQLISEIVAEGQVNLYAMNPRMSRPPEQFAAADPDFWTPKPAAAGAKALAVKKEAPAKK
ncbi:MAG TPA: hypothetical protein VN461_19630 [Vicinamibacteria bacterium]|jgi:hypothetical protein|nr:hypothetical protein [Vicinamibacteria bacterium]